MKSPAILSAVLLAVLALVLLPTRGAATTTPPPDPSLLALPTAVIPLHAYVRLAQVEDNAMLDRQIGLQEQGGDDGGLDWVHVSLTPESFGRLGGYLQTGSWSSSVSPAILHFSYLASVFPDPAHASAFLNDVLRIPSAVNIASDFQGVGDLHSAELVHQVGGGVQTTFASVFFMRANVEVEIGIQTQAAASAGSIDSSAIIQQLHAMAAAADTIILANFATPTPVPTATSVPTRTTAPAVGGSSARHGTCKKGFKRVRKKCKRIKKRHCKKGYVLSHGKCRRRRKHRY